MGEQNIDQHVLAEDVSSKIQYEFMDHFLVKLLDPIMVTKEVTSMDEDRPKPEKDENDIEAVNYEVKSEVKTVESSLKKGIVLKMPMSFTADERVNKLIKVGDVVIFNNYSGKDFDLLKDSRLVRYYDVIAIER